jgi:hypothetical protein
VRTAAELEPASAGKYPKIPDPEAKLAATKTAQRLVGAGTATKARELRDV